MYSIYTFDFSPKKFRKSEFIQNLNELSKILNQDQ